MTTGQRLERDLPTILGDLAIAPYPDYVDSVLSTTAQRRQRPAWTFLERWLPMDLATQRAPTSHVPWRSIGVLALIALLIVAATTAVFVGSQPRIPAPFGLAANGLIADDTGGDIAVIDPVTNASTSIVTGPDDDRYPSFTRDGRSVLFLRNPSEALAGTLYAVGVDGSGLTRLTTVPLADLRWFELLPDGSTLAILSRIEGQLRVSRIDLNRGGMRTFDDVAIANAGGLSLIPPDGREALFVTEPGVDGPTGAIASLDLETGAVRTIAPGRSGMEVWSNVVASPAGDRIAYGLLDQATGVIGLRLMDVDGTNDRPVAHEPGSNFEAWPMYSPSGRFLLFERRLAGIDQVFPVVVDLETGEEVVIRTTISFNGAGKEWAPDESAILAQRTNEDGTQRVQELWDVRTGAVTKAAWGSSSGPSWQRTAP